MGWANCGEDDLGRPIGYAHEGTCDYDGCDRPISRGVEAACGGMHGEEGVGGKPGCPCYFCLVHHHPERHDCPDKIAWRGWARRHRGRGARELC